MQKTKKQKNQHLRQKQNLHQNQPHPSTSSSDESTDESSDEESFVSGGSTTDENVQIDHHQLQVEADLDNI